MQLLSIPEYNPKTKKALDHSYYTPILHLAPHTLSGYQTCPKAGKCKETCLFWSGQGPIPAVVQARIRKTKLFFEDRELFMALLVADIFEAKKKAEKLGMTLALRLNGTSDICWEKIRAAGRRNVMEVFPDVQFYDYTKIFNREVPSNYYLTYSLDERNAEACLEKLRSGHNVAAVFNELPVIWNGFSVIDGDLHDLRFLDPESVVVGLKFKRARLPKQVAT